MNSREGNLIRASTFPLVAGLLVIGVWHTIRTASVFATAPDGWSVSAESSPVAHSAPAATSMTALGTAPCDGEWLLSVEFAQNYELPTPRGHVVPWSYGQMAAHLSGPNKSGEIRLGNETHDCQRLVEVDPLTGARTFGRLQGIYPIAEAVELTSAELRLKSQSGPVAMAAIVVWGEEDKSALGEGLGQPVNERCLWLDASTSPWTAAMVDRGDELCHIQAPPDLSAVESMFEVRQHHLVSGPMNRETSFPPTARWGWHEPESPEQPRPHHYVGIKCGENWCTIGLPGFQPKEADVLNDPPRSAVHGWYDEQHLAILDRRTGKLIPGPWGTIRPLGRLEGYDANGWRRGVAVASIEIVGNVEHVERYARKFGLRITSRSPSPDRSVVAHAAGEVFLRLTSPGGGRGAEAAPPPSPEWDGRIGAVPAKKVSFLNLAHAAHGAVRWRWSEHDEDIWVSCAFGCCFVQCESCL